MYIFVYAYLSILMLIMHIYCIFLICFFVHIPAYLVLHIAAYFLHISAYLNLHIMAYLPVCIFKQITHMFARKMQIQVYFVYLCIFGSSYLYILFHICAYVFFFTFKHIFSSKANQFNEYSNCARRSTRAQLLSLAVSYSLSFSASIVLLRPERPKGR